MALLAAAILLVPRWLAQRALSPQHGAHAGARGMPGMNLLDRYVIRAVLGGVFVVMAVLLTLGALFLFANQQDDIGVRAPTPRSMRSGSCC